MWNWIWPNDAEKTFYGSILNGFGMLVFVLLFGIGATVCLPILIPMAIGYGVIYLWIGFKILCSWLRDKTVLPLICSLAGGLMLTCGGKEGFCIGCAFGFLLGIVFGLVRSYEGVNSYPKPSWFGAPYEDGVYAPQANYNSTYVKPIVERPWSWKGFQVTLGPKEDDIRKDL